MVKGVNFQGLRDVSSPVELAAYYSDSGADELVFYDITASAEGAQALHRHAARGGVHHLHPAHGGRRHQRALEDFDRVLKCGADKVSVNSGAIRDPELIRRAARALRRPVRGALAWTSSAWTASSACSPTAGGRTPGIDAIELDKRSAWTWARARSCVNSIDTDGVKGGFDLEMLQAVCERVNVPVIASGGAGCSADFAELFRKRCRSVSAGLAASIFHFGEVNIPELKRRALRANGI